MCREEHRRFSWHLPLLPENAVLFAQPIVLAQKLRILRRNLGFLRNRPNPLAERRTPDPQIRRNLTPCQATGERNANRIPLELVAVYRCHIRRTHGPTLDGQYCSQKTGTKPVQVQTLHGIADRLQAIQRRNFYQLTAEVSHRGGYCHEYTMSVDVTRDSPTCQPPTEDVDEIVTEALLDLAHWLYRQLQTEYDHLTSNEAIEEGIVINEYTFTEAGRWFG